MVGANCTVCIMDTRAYIRAPPPTQDIHAPQSMSVQQATNLLLPQVQHAKRPLSPSRLMQRHFPCLPVVLLILMQKEHSTFV